MDARYHFVAPSVTCLILTHLTLIKHSITVVVRSYLQGGANAVAISSRGRGGAGRGRGAQQMAASRAKKKAETKARKVPLQVEVRRSWRASVTGNKVLSYAELTDDDSSVVSADDAEVDVRVERDNDGFAKPLPVVGRGASESDNTSASPVVARQRTPDRKRKVISYDDDATSNEDPLSGSVASTPNSARSSTSSSLRRTAPRSRAVKPVVTWQETPEEKEKRHARSMGGGRGDTPHLLKSRRKRITPCSEGSTKEPSDSDVIVRNAVQRMSLTTMSPPKLAAPFDDVSSVTSPEASSGSGSDDEDDTSGCISRDADDVMKFGEGDEEEEVIASDTVTRTTVTTLSELFDSPAKPNTTSLPSCFSRNSHRDHSPHPRARDIMSMSEEASSAEGSEMSGVEEDSVFKSVGS